MNLSPIVAEELVREFGATFVLRRQAGSRLGRLVRVVARGEDLYFEAAGLPGHEFHLGTLRVEPGGLIRVICSDRPSGLCWEPLANPRCCSRLLASIEDHADRWTAGLYQDFESVKDSLPLQRLTALKAFYLAFQAIQAGERSKLLAGLAEILELLGIEEPDHPSRIRREALYRLAQASCRLDEPGLVVQATQHGLKFRQIGSYSPVAPWKKIVDAVCTAAREKKMNHRRRQGLRLPYGRDEKDVATLRRVAESAAEVPKETLDRLGPFLRFGTLEGLARFQRIY